MIDAKEAANKAAKYFEDINQGPLYNLRLEELELSENEMHWYITLSYSLDVLGIANKGYKLFTVESETGRIVAMKIKKF